MDLDMLVAGADPARHADLPGQDSAEAARLYRQITASAPQRRRMRPPAPVVVAGLVAAAAATGADGRIRRCGAETVIWRYRRAAAAES